MRACVARRLLLLLLQLPPVLVMVLEPAAGAAAQSAASPPEGAALAAAPALPDARRSTRHLAEPRPYSPWSAWSTCGRRCSQTRRRRCLQPRLCGAAVLKEERWCSEQSAVTAGRQGLCSGSGGGGGGTGSQRRRRHRGDFHVVPRRQLALEGGRGGGGRRGGWAGGGGGGGRPRPNKLYGRWTRWTPCTRSCLTQRFRWCKRPALCGSDVIREAAYCYVEGSFCQRWIERRIQQQSRDDENETDADLAAEPWEAAGGGGGGGEEGSDGGPGCGLLPGHSNRTWSQNLRLRIIGGRPSPKGRWPWQVVVLNRYREAFCGGTLVAPRWVLTAAHCVRKRLYVRVGEHDLSLPEGTEMELKVLEAVKHPAYDAETVDNDVALLWLPMAVRPGRYRAFACLPPARQPLPTSQLCTIIGWGKRRSSDAFGTDVLHEAQVPIVSWKACRDVYSDYHITSNMFCAGYPRGRMDSCAGDSGGPLLCRSGIDLPRWTVFGITSFGDGCGKRGKFGIYTRLPNYVPWILGEIRRREQRPGQVAFPDPAEDAGPSPTAFRRRGQQLPSRPSPSRRRHS